jgi:hypothetical protein
MDEKEIPANYVPKMQSDVSSFDSESPPPGYITTNKIKLKKASLETKETFPSNYAIGEAVRCLEFGR